MEQNKTSSGWLSQLGHGMSLSAQGLCLGLVQETRAYSSKNSTLGVSGGFRSFGLYILRYFGLAWVFGVLRLLGLGLQDFCEFRGLWDGLSRVLRVRECWGSGFRCLLEG